MNHVDTDTAEALYRATTTPGLVRMPQLRFLYLDGHGDPNTCPELASAVQAPYAVSYGAKLAIKESGEPSYRMSPLEGLFWSEDPAAFTRDGRRHKHHEIYLGDPRRAAPEKLRTISRQSYAG